MRIVAISDLHGNLEGLDLRGADICVIAGDFAIMKGWGIWHINDQVKWINKKFGSWCAQYPETAFCVIPGNHDLFAQHSEVPTKVVWPENVHYLQDRIATVNGLTIAGSPWIPPISGRWAFETSSEDELGRRFSWLPEGLDILITHTPPFVEESDIDVSLQTNSPHFGSRALADVLSRVKPRYHFCGHIHTGDHNPLELVHADGTKTISRNVSRLDEHYEIAFEPVWLEV